MFDFFIVGSVSLVSYVDGAIFEPFMHFICHFERAYNIESTLHKIRRYVSYFADIFFEDKLIFTQEVVVRTIVVGDECVGEVAKHRRFALISIGPACGPRLFLFLAISLGFDVTYCVYLFIREEVKNFLFSFGEGFKNVFFCEFVVVANVCIFGEEFEEAFIDVFDEL